MNISRPSRRTLLTRAALVGAAALPAAHLLSSPAYAAGGRTGSAPLRQARRLLGQQGHVPAVRPSSNGWEMEKAADHRGTVYTRPVPGTPLSGVQVRMGDVEAVLVHVIRRFHYEIDGLRDGEVVGWRSPETVCESLAESNQASGTAVQIRPGHYPAGTRGGLFPLQLLVIRDVLAELDGVVRWGGDDRRPDEALFYLDVGPGDLRLAATSKRIRRWKDSAGHGAGAFVDVSSRARRGAADAMERRQRKAVA